MAVPLGRPGASAGPGRDGFGPTAGLPRPRARWISTELEDVTEVEYRQLRLERVVLVGVWTSG
ncbi:hypothetical protein ABZ203_21410, partial [Streptomyces albidoflavus]